MQAKRLSEHRQEYSHALMVERINHPCLVGGMPTGQRQPPSLSDALDGRAEKVLLIGPDAAAAAEAWRTSHGAAPACTRRTDWRRKHAHTDTQRPLISPNWPRYVPEAVRFTTLQERWADGRKQTWGAFAANQATGRDTCEPPVQRPPGTRLLLEVSATRRFPSAPSAIPDG